jgi:hypothetical protein
MPNTRAAIILAACLLCTACATSDRQRLLDATFEVLPAEGVTGPIGTAFALDDGTFVSAAHVLNGIIGSRYESPFLYHGRSRYSIDAVLRYSQDEDFVVFSATPSTSSQGSRHTSLPATEALPQAAEPLFCAGRREHADASTTDRVIVIDAMVEPLTAEERRVVPSWFAFRGWVTPGMSGGPLVNGRNEVVGVVAGQDLDVPRDANGTHNLAVPMKLVNAPGGARVQTRMENVLLALNLFRYREILGSSERTVFAPGLFEWDGDAPAQPSSSWTIAAGQPLAYADFAAKVLQAREDYLDRALNRWLREPSLRVLIGGANAAPACELLNGAACRAVPPTEKDVALTPDAPEVVARKGASPTLYAGRFDGALLLRRKTAGVMTLETLFGVDSPGMTPERFALRTDERWRDRSPSLELENVATTERYADLHGRLWDLRMWPIKEQDLQLIALARPVADGYVALFRVVPTALAHAATLHLKILANIDSVVDTAAPAQ